MWPEPFRISLLVLFWVVSLVAAGVGAFGVVGIPLAALVVLLWRVRPSWSWSAILFGGLVLLCAGAGLLPAIQGAREAARKTQCINNLKQIGLAILNYRQAKGRWPPSCVRDENGVSMHSWRVLILPYMEEQALYNNYRFDEYWDGPNNRKLIKQMPSCYRCPSQTRVRPGHTTYSAVVGPATIWSSNNDTTIATTSIDSTEESTPMVCETFEHIPWTKPTDVGIEELINSLASHAGHVVAGGHQQETFWAVYPHHVPVVYSDGAVGTLNVPDQVGRLRTRGYETVDLVAWHDQYRLKLGRIVSIVCFVALSIAPFGRKHVTARKKPEDRSRSLPSLRA